MKETNWKSQAAKNANFLGRNPDDTFLVYHAFYTGPSGVSWDPSDIKWGYVGVSCLANASHVKLRYFIAQLEHKLGYYDRDRKVIEMMEKFPNNVKFRCVKKGLSKEEAFKLEAELRPKGHTCFTDNRIWNEIEGGDYSHNPKEITNVKDK
jgi:hypothetical protein